MRLVFFVVFAVQFFLFLLCGNEQSWVCVHPIISIPTLELPLSTFVGVRSASRRSGWFELKTVERGMGQSLYAFRLVNASSFPFVRRSFHITKRRFVTFSYLFILFHTFSYFFKVLDRGAPTCGSRRSNFRIKALQLLNQGESLDQGNFWSKATFGSILG